MIVTAILGGQPVEINWSPVGQFDREEFAALAAQDALLGLDVESTYMTDLAQWSPDFQLRLIQFATSESAWVLNLTDPEQREAAIWLLSREDVAFCSHTQMDVISIMVQLGLDITERNLDTRMLGRMLDSSQDAQNDLKHLATTHDMPELAEAETALLDLFKDLWPGRKNAKRADIQAHGWATVEVTDERFIRYAGLDAIACRRLASLLPAESQQPAALLAVETWLAQRATRIQLRGMRVDLERLEALETEAQSNTGQAMDTIKRITDGLTIGPKLMVWLTQHGANWDAWDGPRTPTGAPSLAKGEAVRLRQFELDEPGSEVVEAMLAYKAHQDALLKTKGVREHLAQDGRVHPSLNTLGAVTGRMSSAGPNFQNFSKQDPRMRGLFIPEPGHVFLTADFDQVELRVVAALAREQKMIDVIQDGGDLHQLTVDELAQLGITISRDVAKMTNFLIVYGGGGKALHEQAKIPLEAARQIVSAHKDRYQAIGALSSAMGRNQDAIRTIAGRLIKVKRFENGQTASYANINYLIQSSARDLLVDAWLKLENVYGFKDAVWYPIHDELVLQVPEDQVEAVTEAVERSMRMDFMGVPISASAVVLRDENGQSRWMTSKLAEKIAHG